MDACVHHVPVPVFEDERCGTCQRSAYACLHCARELPFELEAEEPEYVWAGMRLMIIAAA